MKQFVTILIFTLLSCNTQAQTAIEIIDKYLQAVGGKGLIERVHSVVMKGIRLTRANHTQTILINKVKSKLHRVDVQDEDHTTCLILTPRKRYSYNNNNATPSIQKYSKAESVHLNLFEPITLYNQQEYIPELIGIETVENKLCYKLTLNAKNDNLFVYWIDTTDYHLIQSSGSNVALMGISNVNGNLFAKTQSGEIINIPGLNLGNSSSFIVYKDYKLVNGILFPFTIQEKVIVGNSVFIQTNIFSEIDVNVTVDTKLFEP